MANERIHPLVVAATEPPPTATAPAEDLTPLILFPGEEFGPILVVDLLRDQHVGARLDRAIEVERRKKSAIPLDDDTVWKDVEAFVKQQKGGDLRALAARILETVHEPLDALPAFDEADHARLAPIALTLRAMDQKTLATLRGRLTQASKMWRKADEADDDEAKADADNRYRAVVVDYVVCAATKLYGVKGRDGADVVVVDDKTCAGLDRAGLLLPIFNACQHFQGLSPGKAARFGSSPQST